MTIPETHYARSGDVHVAYQVVGSGSRDLVFVPGFISNLEHNGKTPGSRISYTGWHLSLG